MNVERPRSGIFATVNGIEYLANSYPESGTVTLVSTGRDNPDPHLFQRNEAWGAWVATVPTGSCDRLVEVTTLADYLGHTCQVISIAADGAVGLYYVGDEKSAIVRDGFVQIDPGTWAKTVSIHDLQQYRERHTDLQFDEWKTAE